jgi:Flp pilus assembly protein TadD
MAHADEKMLHGMIDFMSQCATGTSLAANKVDAADIESRYTEATALIGQGRAEEALDLLGRLVMSKPWDRRFWLASAGVLQSAGLHEAAADQYVHAMFLDATDAGCAFHIGECLEAMGERSHAAQAMRDCIKLSRLDPKWGEVAHSAQAALERLEQGARA